MKLIYLQFTGLLFFLLIGAIVAFALENHKLKKRIQEASNK
jgi:GAF domain-containing protein